MATGNFIAYFRVSTQKQGRSELGLDAQREAVQRHLNGGAWRLIAEVEEIESGKRDDRPKLAEALRLCRLYNAVLIIAKLDRLARDVGFISSIMKSGVEFIAVDTPYANKMTLQMLSVFAEHKSEMISSRTKAALSAAKARGKTLGGFRGYRIDAAGMQASIRKRRDIADAKASELAPLIGELQTAGITTLTGIAAELTKRGVATPRVKTKWSAAQVSNVLARLNSHGSSARKCLP